MPGVYAQAFHAADSILLVSDLEKSNRAYFDRNYKEAIRLADNSLILAQQHDWLSLEQKALIILSYSHAAIGDVSDSKMCVKGALGISRRLQDTISQIDLLTFQAGQFQNAWRYDSSFLYYQQALSLAIACNDAHGQGSVYNNMATILAEQNRIEAAQSYFWKAALIAQSIADTSGIFTGYINVARCFITRQELDSAAHYMNRGRMLLDVSNKPLDRSAYYHHLGLLKLAQKSYATATTTFHQALPLLVAADDQYNISLVYKLLGESHLGMQHTDSCLYYLKRAETLSISIGANEVLRDVYPLLARCLAQMENWEQAYVAAVKALDLQEHFWDETLHRHVAEVEVNQQLDKFTTENEYLRRITEKYDQEKRRQRLTIWFSVAFVGIFGIFSYFLWHSKREVSRLNEDLESTVAARTTALQSANEKLQLFLDDQKTFTHVTSHDLKEPLRNISGFATLLERRLVGTLDDEQKEYLAYIRSSALHMNLLIEGIQFYSTIADSAQGSLLEQVSLSALMQRIASSLKMRTQQTGAAIEYPDDLPTIESYAEALQVILKNLVENGIKYNKSPNPKVTVTYEREPDVHLIRVQDNGIGIAQDYHAQVFEMFKRLHTRQEFEGTGMGLAICKKLAERLGGTIRLESAEGQGSIFTLVLPAFPARL